MNHPVYEYFNESVISKKAGKSLINSLSFQAQKMYVWSTPEVYILTDAHVFRLGYKYLCTVCPVYPSESRNLFVAKKLSVFWKLFCFSYMIEVVVEDFAIVLGVLQKKLVFYV